MNVKSRAQLIVWCLPHLGFVESEARIEAAQPAGATAYNTQPAGATMPAGNATITLPGVVVRGFERRGHHRVRRGDVDNAPPAFGLHVWHGHFGGMECG